MLLLLGDQLIRDAGVAVFELVKNAYDADASQCSVTLYDAEDTDAARVVIEDDGVGMDEETVRGVWLEPGTEHRKRQREARKRTKKHKRLPLGEKGVGRFAVHKLGRSITLVTRASRSAEVVVQIDWDAFDTDRYLSDVPVTINTGEPAVFKGSSTGTRIEISHLQEGWTRGKVRDIHRGITSICSPFHAPAEFKALLTMDPDPGWLKGLLQTTDVLDLALFRAEGTLYGVEVRYRYEFRPLQAMRARIKGRKTGTIAEKLFRLDPKRSSLDLGDWQIGKVGFDFRIYDREPEVLALSTADKRGLKQFLDQNGGIRIYRDDVRVYDFGEPGNDWLDLGGRRVNIPTVRVSNNQMLGAVSLAGEESSDLIEKTNREGFIENAAYRDLRDAVLCALTQIEAERKKDKERLRKAYSRKRIKQPVVEELAELRQELQKRRLIPELGSYLNRIERQFLQVREQLMVAAGPGLTLTTVLHEVEKIIKELVEVVKRGSDTKRIRNLVHHLAQMVDGLGFLARKSGNSREDASVLIKQTLFNTEYRLRAHRIMAVNGIAEHGDPDFAVRCVRRLIVSTLMNLVDNSIYWLDQKGGRDKKLYVGTTFELSGKRALVVADNGPGFIDPPEYLIEPFFTRKPDGMGLGLHLANEVAKMHDGKLIFPDEGDVTLPPDFTGAVVVLEFGKGR